jgi:uncharacterized membrane protein
MCISVLYACSDIAFVIVDIIIIVVVVVLVIAIVYIAQRSDQDGKGAAGWLLFDDLLFTSRFL